MRRDWRQELDARVAGDLGAQPELAIELTADGAWCGDSRLSAVWRNGARPAAHARPGALPLATGRWRSAVLSMVGHAPAANDRAALLTELGRVLAAGASLVVVDHNRPRRWSAAVAAVVGAPWVPGCSPAARWRRLAYPTAREIQAAGFAVQWLRFAAGERLQIILARREAPEGDA